MFIVLLCRKETLKPVDTYYDDPDDLLKNPPLPPRKYEGAEEAKTLVSKQEANTGEVCAMLITCMHVCVSVHGCSGELFGYP